MSPKTAILPRGWEDRLFRVDVKYEVNKWVTGYCLEAHDLAVAKYVAGREKDYTFLAVMINKGMLEKKELINRINMTVGIDHSRIITKAKADFKSYASAHLDYKQLLSTAPRSESLITDKEKQEFIARIKKNGLVR